MYSAKDVIPPVRSDIELNNPNPLMEHLMERVAGKTFSSQAAREKVIPVYMGLITQIDDQLGLLFDFMQEKDLLDDTMVVFTSDHGDYFGDHWMGDKCYFHDQSVKVPLIIADPSQSADATRGTTDDSLVELIDLLPTFIDYHGGAIEKNVLDGLSLMPKINNLGAAWREYAISEFDYSCEVFRPKTERLPLDCRSYMIVTQKWKFVYAPGYPAVLFDLVNDPYELNDLGVDVEYDEVRREMFEKLAEWSLQYRQRQTWSEEHNLHMTGIEEKLGVIIGYWDELDAKGKDPNILPKRK